LVLGPAFALLPTQRDHARTSAEGEFDLRMRVRGRGGVNDEEDQWTCEGG